jgi:hypothetical protein
MRVVCFLLIFHSLAGVAYADQPDTKQWEFRIGIGHGSTFNTAPGAPYVNGIAGQIQYNFAPNLFIQGTVVYQINALGGSLPNNGAFGFAIIGYQFP